MQGDRTFTIVVTLTQAGEHENQLTTKAIAEEVVSNLEYESLTFGITRIRAVCVGNDGQPMYVTGAP